MSKLRINALVDDSEDVIAYYAKGHWGKAQMVEAIRCLVQFEFNPSMHTIETRHFRWVPAPKKWVVPFEVLLTPATQGKGAFLATVVWLQP